VIKDGETGLLAEERKSSQLCEKILWLVNHPGLWRPMLDKGRKHIEEQFDAKVQGLRLSEIYEKVVR
jgi:colanic acid/amylovoran biosynthesis glycosyltransferase